MHKVSCYVLILAQSPGKLPATKVLGVESKIGVATCITKAESTSPPDSQFGETTLKQPVACSSGRSVADSEPSLLRATQQVGLSQFSSAANGSNDEHLVNLHGDSSLPPSARTPHQHASQLGDVQHPVVMGSLSTCSNNSARSTETDDTSYFDDFGMHLLLLYNLFITVLLLRSSRTVLAK